MQKVNKTLLDIAGEKAEMLFRDRGLDILILPAQAQHQNSQMKEQHPDHIVAIQGGSF